MEAAMVGTPSELQLLPKKIYLNSEYGLKSWLLTQDHQRIVLLYPFTTSFFFVIGGTAASLNSIRTPYGRRRSRDLGYLHQTIFHIWHHHCFFLFGAGSASCPGQLFYTSHDRREGRGLREAQRCELVPVRPGGLRRTVYDDFRGR
jgi:hypothetical protein